MPTAAKYKTPLSLIVTDVALPTVGSPNPDILVTFRVQDADASVMGTGMSQMLQGSITKAQAEALFQSMVNRMNEMCKGYGAGGDTGTAPTGSVRELLNATFTATT